MSDFIIKAVTSHQKDTDTIRRSKNFVKQQYSRGKKYRHPYYINPIEMGLLWAKITCLKTHSKALVFGFQTDMK